MKSKLILMVAVILIGIGAGYILGIKGTGFGRKGNIRWLGYNEGMEKAKRENKQVLLNFVIHWCEWCNKMDEETFGNKEVRGLIEKGFIPIRVDVGLSGETHFKGRKIGYKELAVHYNVKEVPTTWFIEADGTLIAMMPGKIEPDYFIKTLGYMQDRAYKTKITLAEYAGVKRP